MRIQRTTRLTPLHIATVILLGGFCFSTAHGQASFQGLGDLPGGSTESFAFDLSIDGSVVIGGSASALGNEGFSWTSGGGMVGLGDLAGPGFDSRAFGMSGDGSVVVGRGLSASGSGALRNEAFRWTSGGGMVGLGDLAGGIFFSLAWGVSADGSVVVGFSRVATGSTYEAFRWTSGGGMVGLGDLPGGSYRSTAYEVSADGSVVVGYSISASSDPNFEAFRWTSGDNMVGLGDLPGGIFESSATDVSADGSVVVGFSTSDSGQEAFRWTSEGGMLGLGDLPGGSFNSGASAISADATVVVGKGSSASGNEAFIWDAANGMLSLQTVLEGLLGFNLTGWTLTDAWGVSSDGTAIVGRGTNPDGRPEAFIAIIPGPNVCPGDVVGLDGNVNVTDLLSLLGGWGANPGHPADINDDGQVNVTDLLALLGAWGPCP